MDFPKLTPEQFRDYIMIKRGYGCEPIYNTTEHDQTGAVLRLMGYAMVGPRRTRGCITIDADGMLSLLTVSLWCDAVDYANQRVAEKLLSDARYAWLDGRNARSRELTRRANEMTKRARVACG